MPHARLLAASSLVTAALLALGPEAVVALADTDSGSSSTGTSGGSTTGTSGTTTGTTTGGSTTGGTTTGSDTSTTTGGSTTGSTTTTGSSTTTGSTTGSSSAPNLQTTLGGMVGQFTRIIQHPTSIIGGAPLTGLVPGVKPKPGQNAPLLTPGGSSTFSASVPAPANSGAAQPSAAVTPDSTVTTPDTTAAAAPKSPLAQLPLVAAQVPLTALDLVKTTLPAVVDAVPIPGLAALPVFADALITPIETTVRELATAASNLPFLQYTPGMPAIQLPPDSRSFPQNSPQMPKTFAASTDSLPRDISPGAPGTTDKPVPPVQPRDVFDAKTRLLAANDFRPGYPDYLRAAGLSEVAAVAVPGFAGIITLTAAGGLVGYRQARATSSAPARARRFVN